MRVRRPRGEGQQKAPYKDPDFEASNASHSIRDTPLGPGAWERLRRAVVRAFETVLLEPQSTTQKEQLARKILDYSRMNRRGSEAAIIDLPAMAVRFGEPRRNVRQSLEFLEEQGTIERTQSKDHWKLSNPGYFPIRAAYNPPRASTPFPKMPANPPPGWMELQTRAHKAKDAQEFNEIIYEMNRLLSAQEKGAGEGQDSNELPPDKAHKKAASDGNQK
jgi:hypothetical protein